MRNKYKKPSIITKKPKKDKRPTLYAIRWKEDRDYYVHWQGEKNEFVLKDEIHGAATFTKDNARAIVKAEEEKELEYIKVKFLKYQLM